MKRLTTKEFIAKSKAFHGSRYTYAKAAYRNNKTKVSVGCRKHGMFRQRAAEHIKGHGCPKCSDVYTTSPQENAWLDSKRVSKDHRNKRLVIGKRAFNVDAYIPRSKTVYEFYGDYWHGNPDVHGRKEINTMNGWTFGDLYDRTMAREKALKRAGYKVVSIWESDWKDGE
jgi:hypothetical protein